eukprot:COSAG04_NODE_6819_length_1249_cov_1.013043_1_plen_146_part_00
MRRERSSAAPTILLLSVVLTIICIQHGFIARGAAAECADSHNGAQPLSNSTPLPVGRDFLSGTAPKAILEYAGLIFRQDDKLIRQDDKLKEDYYALVGIIAGLIFCVGLASCPPLNPDAWTRIDLRKHRCGPHPPGHVSARLHFF